MKYKVIGAALKPQEIELLAKVRDAGGYYTMSATIRDAIRHLAQKILSKSAHINTRAQK